MNWNRISPRNFEKFVFHALKYEDFYDRKWMGGTGGEKGV